MLKSILLVEDEQSIVMSLQYLLEKEGFAVHTAQTGTEAIKIFQRESVDLILLDIILPEMSGIEVCREIRAKSAIPIIMVTSKNSEIDKVLGLEMGADDYITKPYSAGELVARIHAVLRRSSINTQNSLNDKYDSIQIDNMTIDFSRHIFMKNDVEIPLPLKEFELLSTLLHYQGQVLTRHQIIREVWGSDYIGNTKTLDVHIKRLRERIETSPSNPQHIRTIRGVGYRFD